LGTIANIKESAFKKGFSSEEDIKYMCRRDTHHVVILNLGISINIETATLLQNWESAASSKVTGKTYLFLI